MKILITASTFPRWQGDAVPDFVLNQANALIALHPDCEIHVLAPHHQGAALNEKWGAVQIHRFRYLFPESWQRLVYPAIQPNIRHNRWLALQVPLLLGAEFIAVWRLLRRLRADVLYSHWFMPQAVVGGVVCLLLNVPHVFTSHSSDVQVLRSIPLLGPWLVRLLTRRAAACSVVSQRSLGKLRAFFGDPGWRQVKSRVQVIPMGVDVAALQAHRQPAALPQEPGPVVLFLGRLTEKKGITYLLQAFSLLVKQFVAPPPRLWIVGDGEMAPQLRDEVFYRGLGSFVQMPGYLLGEEKVAILARADILVVPSIVTADGDAEGLPVSLMEGLAAGKLCVATEESGADELLRDGENGYLVAQKDPFSLYDGLSRALSLDSAAAAAMRASAQQTAAALDWPLIAERHWSHLFAPLQRG